MAEKLYVRLKPHNPKRGILLRRYSYRGIKFHEGHWYKVPEQLAKELSAIHQRHGDDLSPHAFDVATEMQANSIEDAERKRTEDEKRRVRSAEVVGAKEVREADIHALVSGDLAALDADVAVKKSLGMDMTNTKDELIDMAEMLSVPIATTWTKRQILDALEAHVADGKV